MQQFNLELLVKVNLIEFDFWKTNVLNNKISGFLIGTEAMVAYKDEKNPHIVKKKNALNVFEYFLF